MENYLSACNNQVMAFFRHLDDRDYESLTQRLSPDAVWQRQGQVLKGRAAVHQALLKRSATMRIHHLITNLVADRIDDQVCHMRAYMLVVRHDAGKEPSGPSPLSGIENIRTTHIILRRSDSEWLISDMRNDEPSFAVET